MSYIVENGRLMQLAVTGVQQFNPAEEGCPTRWFFKNVQGRKEPARVWHTEGDDVQAQLDHYLATGEDVLGKIARPAKTKNLLPAPGPNLIIDLGLNNERRPPPKNGRKVSYFPREQSLLHAAGIPFIGFLDLVNPRGVTVGEEGEPITDGLPEVIDHKTTKSFKWAKTKEQLLESTQMNGYGVFVLDQTGADAVRLSHNAYLTDPALKADARKATIVVSAAAVRERWTRVVEPIVERMKSVAAATREQDVPGNLGACESFGGCPHKTYCPTYNQQNALKRISMGLLQNRKPAAAVPAPNGAAAPQVPAPPGNMPWVQPTGAPQPPPQAYAAPAQQPAPVHQFMPQAAPVAPQYAAPPAAPPPPPAPPAPVAAAPTGAPLIRDVIAAGAAVQGQKYLVREVPTMYLCSTGGKQSFIPLIGGQPILTEYTEGIVALPADYAIVQAPPPQAPAAAPPAPPPPPAPMQTAPPPPPAPQASSTPPPPPAAPATATRKPRAPRAAAAPTNGSVFALFVNAIPNGGFTDLSGYVYEAVAEMQEQFQVADIRVAPSDGPLGFSKWKGVLAGMVRAQPPPPGTYVAFTKGNELTEIVVEALVPLCGAGALVRGV